MKTALLRTAIATAVAILPSISMTAQAQSPASSAPIRVAKSGPERVNLVIVYGDDACPPSNGDEIVVCARKDEQERFRIPEDLRGDPNAPANQAWGERARSIEYVGASGTNSCSPTGGGGFTGCFNQIAQKAKAEHQQARNASWTDLVAAERAKRLSTIDKDSDAIEARVKAEEAAKAKADATPPATPAPQ